jgi:hypothetical protein
VARSWRDPEFLSRSGAYKALDGVEVMGFNIWLIIALVVIVAVLLIVRKKQQGG